MTALSSAEPGRPIDWAMPSRSHACRTARAVSDVENHPGHDAAPDSWIRIFSNTTGSLNELHGSVPQADALMDAGLHATDPATIQQDYAQAGALVAQSGEWVSIADVRDVVVSHAGVSGWYFQLPTADTVVLGNLTYTKAP